MATYETNIKNFALILDFLYIYAIYEEDNKLHYGMLINL